MTNAQREELVTHWMDAKLDEAEDWRALNGPITDECREGMTDLVADKRQEVECAWMGSDYQLIEKEADELLTAAGLPLLAHGSEDFKRLCRRLLVGKQDVLRIDQGTMGRRLHRTSAITFHCAPGRCWRLGYSSFSSRQSESSVLHHCR